MNILNKMKSLLPRAANNSVFIDVCLMTSFAVLCVRSVNQQNNIETLEAENENLSKSNKAMRKAMWDWKQQLLAEAASVSPLVPLATLMAVYGEAPAPQIEDAVKRHAESTTSSIVI